MDQLINRPTTAFICHPNAVAIAREIDMAMARCGLLASETASANEGFEVQIVAGAGMWHLLRVTPMRALWGVMDSRGTPFFQLLSKQLAVPGFAAISDPDHAASQVFLELDAQGDMRASGEWRDGSNLGEIRLVQPIQPFSSGLISLWAQGQTQAAIDGIAHATPTQAFLRFAIKRLGSELLATSEDWSASVVFASRYVLAPEADVHAFLLRIEEERAQQAAAEAAARLEQMAKAARAAEVQAATDAQAAEAQAAAHASLEEIERADARAVAAAAAATVASLEPNAPSTDAHDSAALAAQLASTEQAPGDGHAAFAGEKAIQAAVSVAATVAVAGEGVGDVGAAVAPADRTDVAGGPGADGAAEAETFEPSYADGQRIAFGDAVAIDGGLSGGRLQTVMRKADAPGGFAVELDVGGGRLHTLDGAAFLNRATLLGHEALSYHAADGHVVDWLQKRVSQEDGRAMLFLGIRLLRGSGIDKDPRKAYEYLVRAADHNEAMAQYLVGMMSKSPNRSAKYWAKAAEQGHAASQFCLGIAHLQGNGVALDAELGVTWLTRAAEQGQLAAMYALGLRQSLPEQALEEDPDLKLSRLQHKAEQGDWVAACVLGRVAVQSADQLDADHAAQALLNAANANFKPAWAQLAELANNRPLGQALQDEVRAALMEHAAQGSTASQLALGMLQTSDLGSNQLESGLRHLHEAAASGEDRARGRIHAVQVALLATAPAMVEQVALVGDDADQRDALIERLLNAAWSLQVIGDGNVVAMGPNARAQVQSLLAGAAQLGDASAAQSLEALRDDPRWAQAQLLDQLTRNGVAQSESLASPNDFGGMALNDLDKERKSPHTAEDVAQNAAALPMSGVPSADALETRVPADTATPETLEPNAGPKAEREPGDDAEQTPGDGPVAESAPAPKRRPWWKFW